MPEVPEEKPLTRGRGTGSILRGRGRGSTPGSAGALPSERLSSIRAPAASNGSGSKMKFKPTIPARRNKKEPSALLAEEPAEVKPERKDVRFARGRGGSSRGRGRGRVEFIQSVTGPFAQGPASLGGGLRRGASGFSMGVLPSSVKAEGTTLGSMGIATDSKAGIEDALGDIDLNDPNAPVVLLTDHNECAQGDEFDVQTEEMAIKAVEEMTKLKLDYSVAAKLEPIVGIKKEGSDPMYEEKMVVLQIPAMPEFEVGQVVLQRRLAEKQKRIVQRKEAAAASEEDTKPDIANMDVAEVDSTDADVKPDIAKLDADGNEDIKPDISTLGDKGKAKVEDDTEKEEVAESDASNIDGRIGTLVVLKSGAVRMKIGDILLDVSQGADSQFLRGLLAVDMHGSNSAFMLGNVDEQFVCTPDLDSIV
ncbi:RNA polymerase III RPC4-domain-containing protein [Coemansia spiralis]|nr:RNA polymerase III RPC4-domain-containing protein [Coemansia spiralis]